MELQIPENLARGRESDEDAQQEHPVPEILGVVHIPNPGRLFDELTVQLVDEERGVE